MTVQIYAERDLIALDKAGNHYCRHVDHMTKESLHSKSDIAAELGWRDMQIADLKRKVEALTADNSRLNDVAKGGAFVMQKALMKYEFGVGMTEQAEHFIRDANEEFEATDAALAEIRAQGVDMAIEHLTKKFEGTGSVGVLVMTLEHLASELRKEAGK